MRHVNALLTTYCFTGHVAVVLCCVPCAVRCDTGHVSSHVVMLRAVARVTFQMLPFEMRTMRCVVSVVGAALRVRCDICCVMRVIVSNIGISSSVVC